MNFAIHRERPQRRGGFTIPAAAWSWLALALLLAAALPLRTAQAQAWVMSQSDRMAYLQYYAPIIMQRAEEDSGKQQCQREPAPRGGNGETAAALRPLAVNGEVHVVSLIVPQCRAAEESAARRKVCVVAVTGSSRSRSATNWSRRR